MGAISLESKIYQTCATLFSMSSQPRINTPDYKLSGVVSEGDTLWDNGAMLSYCFMDPDSGTSAQQAKVHHVAKEWENYANITFEHVDSQDAIIRITFNDRQGSWSKLGNLVLRDATLGEPTMNLGWIEDDDAISDIERGVILHEFGHALGLGHEYDSPPQAGTLTLNEEVTIQCYQWHGFTEQEVRRHLLSPYKKRHVTHRGSMLNFKSVMMYFMPSELNEQNQDVRPNTELSELDKAYALLRYPPDDPATKVLTVDEALRAADVDWKLQRKFGTIYSSRNHNPDYWKEMRILLNTLSSLQANNETRRTRKRLRVHTSPTPQRKKRRSHKKKSASDKTNSESGDTPGLSPEAEAIKAEFERILDHYDSNDRRCLYGCYGEVPV